MPLDNEGEKSYTSHAYEITERRAYRMTKRLAVAAEKSQILGSFCAPWG